MENSKIEWCTHTFNPWHGCVKVSAGCEHCYAESFSKRTGHNVWGPAKTTDRRLFGDKHWAEPLKWNIAAKASGERHRVFCASMADVFEDHPQVREERARLLDLIVHTPHLDWLLLTKRPENINRLIEEATGFSDSSMWFHSVGDHVWIGTSVEDQRAADERIPELLNVPAKVRFLSCEPLLGTVDLDAWFGLEEGNEWDPCLCDEIDPLDCPCIVCEGRKALGQESGIDWVIVGGESGHGARPMQPYWAQQLRDQCTANGVAYFFKQWGEYSATGTRVGKKATGRLLDGQEWSEFPLMEAAQP